MADRAIYATKKNGQGEITALCADGVYWSPRVKLDAIQDIDSGVHTYYVPWSEGRTEIRVAEGPTGRYLRTDRDSTTRNNLEDLPDCQRS